MRLKELLAGIEVLGSNVDPETEIDSVTYDSRKVSKNSLFVAVTGFASDGNRFIPTALEKGAAAVSRQKSRRGISPMCWCRRIGWRWR